MQGAALTWNQNAALRDHLVGQSRNGSMAQQIPISADALADLPHTNDGTNQIAPDLACRRLAMVNVIFYGIPGKPDRDWVLMDTGVLGLCSRITHAAADRFGVECRPAAIILTHGHFDHVGCLAKLAEDWNAPIFAHPLEHPYLNGTASYPPPDTTVGGGIMPTLVPLFPRDPVDVSSRQNLPADGSVPFMEGWRWPHTPGHAVGHISLWREKDRTLIVGDAFVATAQESAYSVATQSPGMHGPPKYFTHDWQAAKASVEMLAALEPELVITGHGRAIRGAEMRETLHALARDFDRIAVPQGGHFVTHPARAEDGTAYRT